MLPSNPKVIEKRKLVASKARKLKIQCSVPDTAVVASSIVFTCSVCKHKWTSILGSFLTNSGCPECARQRVIEASRIRNKGRQPSNTMSLATFMRRLQKGYKVLEYRNHPHTCKVLCDQGHLRETTAQNILRFRCRECTGLLQSSKSHTEAVQKLNPKVTCVTYNGSRTLSEYICTCGYSWHTTPTNILKANRCVCPNCDRSKGSSVKTYKLGRKLVRVRGYEPQALDYIQNSLKYKATDCVVAYAEIPKIEMRGRKPYVADIWISKDKRLVEVKSLGTLGVNGVFCKSGWSDVKRKRVACIKQGYTFSLLVFNAQGQRIRLKTNWYELPLKQALL